MSLGLINTLTLLLLAKRLLCFTDSSVCTKTQYYDVNTYQCLPCGTNQVVSSDSKIIYF